MIVHGKSQLDVEVTASAFQDMASPLGVSGTVSVNADDNGSSIAILISERAGVNVENLSLSTWGASFVLANQLHKLRPPICKRTTNTYDVPGDQEWTLEIGSGTGLVGLAAAALWQQNAVLTDLPGIIPALAENIQLNETLFKKRDVSVISGSLDWTQPSQLRIHSQGNASEPRLIEPQSAKPSIILAADTIYSEEHPELLVGVIATWLAPGPNSRAILCYPLRMAYIDHIRDFWERMENQGFESVDEGRETGTEDWNEIAHTPYEWCVWRWKA